MKTKRKIEFSDDCVGLYVSLHNFPVIYSKLPTADHGINPRELEAKGKELMDKVDKMDSDFPKLAYKFFREVMQWSGRRGNIWLGEHSESEKEKIVTTVAEAVKTLNKSDIKSAISIMTTLSLPPKQMGIATGSLVLHALSPEQVGAYDSVQAKHWGYSNVDVTGFVEFCKDCQEVAAKLNNLGISNPKRDNGKWFSADVNSVFFRLIYKEKDKKQ